MTKNLTVTNEFIWYQKCIFNGNGKLNLYGLSTIAFPFADSTWQALFANITVNNYGYTSISSGSNNTLFSNTWNNFASISVRGNKLSIFFSFLGSQYTFSKMNNFGSITTDSYISLTGSSSSNSTISSISVDLTNFDFNGHISAQSLTLNIGSIIRGTLDVKS